jgi:dynein heavy chain
VGAMDLPGGGKNDIPNRLKRHFFMLTVVTPSPSSVAAIYGILLQSRFDAKEFKYLGGEFPGFVQRMPPTTMALFKWLREKMLPSPTKFHYTFTLKDLSRLFQGVLRTPKSTYTQDSILVQLWRHECERVFSDKLVNLQDKDRFKKELDLVSKQLTGAAPAKGKRDRPPSALKSPTKRGKSVSRPGSAPAADVHARCTAPALFVDFLRDDEYDEDGILARSRRVDVLRGLHAIDATRVHLTSMRVVSFLLKRPFLTEMLRAGRGSPQDLRGRRRRRYSEKKIQALPQLV